MSASLPVAGFPRHLLEFAAVGFEFASRGEFSESVSNHFICDKDREMLFAVMNSKGVSYEIGGDHTGTCPCLDDALLVRVVERLHLFEELGINVGAFFRASSHGDWKLGTGN